MKHTNIESFILVTLLTSCAMFSPRYTCEADTNDPNSRDMIRSMVVKPCVNHCVETSTNAVLETADDTILFSIDSKKIKADNICVWMNGPATLGDEGWSVLNADIERVILPLISSKSILSNSAPIKTIILDPGHGGEDSGASGISGKKEKTLVLDIARRTRAHLEKSGYKVKMTRGTDAYVALKKRTELAKDWDADLFVSIHLNSAQNIMASGVETFVLPAPGLISTLNGNGSRKKCDGNRFDTASIVMASKIHSGILNSIKSPDRGIKHARFEVLRTAPCPAVLIECGFLSNIKEEQKLLSAEFREAIAQGISNGIKDCTP